MAFIGNQPTAVPLTSSQLADGLITTDKLAADAVTSAKIADGAIVNADIASTTINLTQKVTGTLPFANGGTGLSTLGTAGQALIVNSSATALSYATVGATAGQVIQVVQTVKTDTFSTASDTFVDVTGLSVSITPSSASNKILVIAMISGAGNNDASARLLRDSTAIMLGDAAGSRTRASTSIVRGGFEAPAVIINYLDSPNTTSATTYKIQVNCFANVYINRESGDVDEVQTSRTASSITVMEIKG